MPLPQFDDLPFNTRPDLSPYLIHLTKNTKKEDKYSAFDNLVSILKGGKIFGSHSSKGFIKGPYRAACFMDIPFQALKYILTPENADPQNPRYEPYGVLVTKGYAYRTGCRPVLYLSNFETKLIGVPKDELWRVVRFEVRDDGWISWLHEREWRCRSSFKMPSSVHAVLVKNTKDAMLLNEQIVNEPHEFKCKPRSIIPLTIVSQGLLRPTK
jgi:hypothetical protein